MMKIFFCDDDRVQLSLYTALAQKSILLQNWDIQIGYSALNSKDLLAHLPSQGETGIYFLDIDLKDERDGFWLASEIRRYDPRAFLIFITAHLDRAADTFLYRLEAMDFIGKTRDSEEMKEQIHSCIRLAYERYEIFSRQSALSLVIKTGGSNRFLPCDQILYITVPNIPHQIRIFTANEMLDCRESLTNIEKKYASVFLKCQRSLLVNRMHIQQVDLKEKTISLSNNTVHSFSLRCLPNIKSFLAEHTCSLS